MTDKTNIKVGNSLRKLMSTDPIFKLVAYFSMEIGLKETIPTYSGGMGILAGDILKSASDLGVPMCGVTILYKTGYFCQNFDQNNWQTESDTIWDPTQELDLLPNRISIRLGGRDVHIAVWRYNQTGLDGFKLPIYFLDTDLPENHPDDRKLTKELYGGDDRYRLCQEMILGVGGLRILRDMGYKNIETFHLNEGHAGFITLELMRELGYYDEEKVKNMVVFTTHTPVPAGHDYFPFTLIEQVFEEDFVTTIKRMMPDVNGVNMTDLAMRFCRYVNGVAQKHAQVSNIMFSTDKVDWITNGVHAPTWTGPQMTKLLNKHLPGWQMDPCRLAQTLAIPDEEIWQIHQASKMQLLSMVMEKTGIQLNPDLLTIGFARRFATYKRADLIFYDVNKLLQIGQGKLQFIFAGKSHPQDMGGKTLLQKIRNLAAQLRGKIEIVFIDNYSMEIANLITQGSDVWLNTPIRPREASGTSGMKCAMNGVLNFSVLDGWWIEGCFEDITGWSIGPEPTENTLVDYDESLDIQDMYNKLETKIIPTYYQNRHKWTHMMKSTIALDASFFNTQRVVREYCEKAYGITFRGL